MLESAVKCEVEDTREFKEWWDRLSMRDQEAITEVVQSLEREGDAPGGAVLFGD